jgi:HAD superfamily hydrolase (TIGR01484 family)
MLKPLAQFPLVDRRRVRVLLTDIDDTLTDRGRLSAAAYHAMERLQLAGIEVVAVTGRPAGWCDLIARQWPVAGVVGENGAFFFRYDDATRTMTRHYAKDASERRADREKLAHIRERVLVEVPGAGVSADQPYRDADLAIDFREDVPPLPADAVQRIVEIFEECGAVAKISSIHVNGWFGGYDKLTTSRILLKDVLGVDVDRTPHAVAYIGDSPNDMPMFRFFKNSVGVANVLDFEAILASPPNWLTKSRGGQGFAELAESLIEARKKRP